MNLDTRTVDASIANARKAEQAGFDTFWIPGGWRDPATVCTVSGVAVPRMGMKFERPIRYLREYLTILMTAMEKDQVDFDGEMLSAHTELKLRGLTRPQVLIAALGPQAVRVAAQWCDGFAPFMVSPRWLENHTMPEATRAAAEVGRPRPYLCAQVPVCLSDEPARARAACAKMFANYCNGYYPSYRPSYRVALDRDGVGGPEDLAIYGNEKTIERGIAQYRDLGANESMGVVYGEPEEQARTFAYLVSLGEANRH